MREMQYLVDRRVVSAGEAAASNVLYLYDYANPGGVSRSFPLETPSKRWPIVLYSLMVEMQDSSFNVREGRFCQLVGVYPTTVFNLTDQEVFSWGHPITFHGAMPLDYGFGVLFWLGSLTATDIIYVRAHYALRRGQE